MRYTNLCVYLNILYINNILVYYYIILPQFADCISGDQEGGCTNIFVNYYICVHLYTLLIYQYSHPPDIQSANYYISIQAIRRVAVLIYQWTTILVYISINQHTNILVFLAPACRLHLHVSPEASGKASSKASKASSTASSCVFSLTCLLLSLHLEFGRMVVSARLPTAFLLTTAFFRLLLYCFTTAADLLAAQPASGHRVRDCICTSRLIGILHFLVD